MAASSSATLFTASLRIWRSVSSEKSRSTRLSHDDEVEMDPRMLLEPRLHLRMLVRGVVVEDDVKIELPVRRLLHIVEEAQKLLMPMPGQALVDHLTAGHVQRGKECRRPMPLIIVRHGPCPAFL